jgi:hypothetical protein
MPGTKELRSGILPDDTAGPRDQVLEDCGSSCTGPGNSGFLAQEDTLQRSTGPPALYLVSFLRL